MSPYFSNMSNNFKKWLPIEKFYLLATLLYISLKRHSALNSDSVYLLVTLIGRNRHDKEGETPFR